MLDCGHDRRPFGSPLCEHLRVCRQDGLEYLRYYTGTGLAYVLLCRACCDERATGRAPAVQHVCEPCFERAARELGELTGFRGEPEIRQREEPFDAVLSRTPLPAEAGIVVDLAPIDADGEVGSRWLLLAADGLLSRFNADTGAWTHAGRAKLGPETGHEPWAGHVLRHRLYIAPGGDFAAVVNDYGHRGQIVDLRSGRATLELDGGSYHAETVPFSFGFARVAGQIVAVHRTAWNRLDVSDPETGALLSPRESPRHRKGGPPPEHYLDYFHGALHVNPAGTWLADDGWVWAPVGVPIVWSLERWLAGNVWESEDGPTQRSLCQRSYYWNRAMTWLDDRTIAVGGIGEDDDWMLNGARIFEVTDDGVHERLDFPGPAGQFFSDGRCLYASDPSGLSRWDPGDGARTGVVQGLQPTRYNRTAAEFAKLEGGFIVRCRLLAR